MSDSDIKKRMSKKRKYNHDDDDDDDDTEWIPDDNSMSISDCDSYSNNNYSDSDSDMKMEELINEAHMFVNTSTRTRTRTEQKQTIEELAYFEEDNLNIIEQEIKSMEQTLFGTSLQSSKPLLYRILKLNDAYLNKKSKKIIITIVRAFQNMDQSGDTTYFKYANHVKGLDDMPFGIYIPPIVGLNACDLEIAQATNHFYHTIDQCLYGQHNAKNKLTQIMHNTMTNPSSSPQVIGLEGPPGVGKCLGRGTKVLLFNGTIKCVEDIQVGELLMGDDSRPRRVLTTCQGTEQLYKVYQDGADDYIVNASHILSLKTFDEHIHDISITEVLITGTYPYRGYQVPLHFPHTAVPMDPYLFGRSYCQEYDRIPEVYMRNDINTRTQLLQGIIERYGPHIQTTHIRAQSLLYLIRSIGRKAQLDIRTQIIHIQDTLLTNRIHIEPHGIGEYFGFEIDGNKRFLLGDFTVTHNTTLIKHGLAKAHNRPFFYISLGGMKDGSILEGHLLGYEGANNGWITRCLISGNCMNPIFFLDEADKISNETGGADVSRIIMDITCETQNNCFHDNHYLGIDFDLSKAIFIFAYNNGDLIDPTLMDRITNIKMKGYNVEEKKNICRQYTIEEMADKVGMKHDDVIFSNKIIKHIINTYAYHEKGVRSLRKAIQQIYMKLNILRFKDIHPNVMGQSYIQGLKFPLILNKKIVDILLKDMKT